MKTVTVKFPWASLEVEDSPYFADPSYESDNFARLLELDWPLRGGVILDVGAHQGIYSVFLSKLMGITGIIYAFEPNPVNWPLLGQNTQPRDACSPVCIMPFALGRNNVIGGLRCWHTKEGASGQGQLIIGEEPDYVIHTGVRCLDGLVIPRRICFIKIDVEHWEWEILSGGLQTILRDRPRMLIETHNTEAKDRIKSLCEVYRFKVEEWEAFVPKANHVSQHLFIETDVGE